VECGLRGLNQVGEHVDGGLRGLCCACGGARVLRTVAGGVKEVLFVVFVGDVVSEGAVCDGVCDGVLSEISSTVDGRVLL